MRATSLSSWYIRGQSSRSMTHLAARVHTPARYQGTRTRFRSQTSDRCNPLVALGYVVPALRAEKADGRRLKACDNTAQGDAPGELGGGNWAGGGRPGWLSSSGPEPTTGRGERHAPGVMDDPPPDGHLEVPSLPARAGAA